MTATAGTRTYVAEWTKLRTLRSTWATVVGSFALSVFLAYVVASQQAGEWESMTPAQQGEIDPVATSLIGVLFATVIFGSLAVRSITSEHSTGMIRLTFSAMPQRRSVLVSKAAIVGGIALGTALAANVLSFVVGQQVMASVGVDASLGDPDAARSIVLGSLAVGATAVLGVGLGSIVRRTAIGTTVLAVAIIGSQMFAGIVPDGARKYLPGNALQATVTGERTSDLLAPVTATLTFAGYAGIALVVAVAIVNRRDV